jgi:hypothetical protein
MKAIAAGAGLAVAACGSRTGLPLDAIECANEKPTCVVPAAGCDSATIAPAVCNSAGLWACPQGSRVYARAPPTPRCLPFRGTQGLTAIGGWGLGSLARVPTDDGRCLWIADSATLTNGTVVRNVAFEADPSATLGTCPDHSLIPPTPVVAIEGGDDSAYAVQINGGYRLGGTTHILYRIFRYDSGATFGLTLLGGGVARWNPAAGVIVVPSPQAPFPWGTDLDLGDANLPSSDAAYAYAWGCGSQGGFLTQGCRLARLDAADIPELYAGGGSWIGSVRALDGAVVFQSGTWMSSVVPAPLGPLHVYIVDFGSEILSHVASAPTGPWSDGAGFGPCDLPAGDPKAFCAGPIVHTELADPTRPGELPIVYGVGTTGVGTGRVEDYWPRLGWAP